MECRTTKRNERGYLLLSIMLLITIMLVMLAAEAPRVAQQIKRAKEEELVNRGKEYAIAIRKYVHKMGTYPTSLEQLEDTNHIRFLRKRYTDPMTGKADWKLIHPGEAEVKMPQNLNNPGLQGSGNPGLSGSAPAGGNQTNSSGLSTSPSGVTGLNQGGTQPSGITGLNAGGTQPGQVGSLRTSNLGNGQTFGGGGIIGVASTSKQTGIKEFNGNSEYDQWLFVYDPKLEQASATFGGAADAGVVVASPRANAGSDNGNPSPSGSPAPGGNSNPNATPNPSPTP